MIYLDFLGFRALNFAFVEEETHQHSGIAERSGLLYFLNFIHSCLHRTTVAQVQEGQEILRSFLLLS